MGSAPLVVSLLHTGGYVVPVSDFKKTTSEYTSVHLVRHTKNAPCDDRWVVDCG